MNCPICDGELRVINNDNGATINHQCYCTRCKRYAKESAGYGNTIWIGKLELYGIDREIKKDIRYKKILLWEKIKYKRKKIIQKLFKNY